MKVLVTLGPTQELIDPIRYITNSSSGKMGAAMIKEGVKRGHDVSAVSGPINIKIPLPEKNIRRVTAAEEMIDCVLNELENGYDIFISAAAIADYAPVKKEEVKIKSGQKELTLRLKPNPKLTRMVRGKFSDLFMVGFKAEYALDDRELIKSARSKLIQDNLDLVVANDVSRNRFGSDENEAFIVDKKHERHINKDKKEIIAKEIWNVIEDLI